MSAPGTDGKRGEEAAARLALRRGANVIARNYAAEGGELDLVLDEEGTVVFCEVKTRRSRGSGFEAVTPRKQERITRAACAFLRERGLERAPCRFDVVVVVPIGEGTCSIQWMKDAFAAAGIA
ncbi:MAG TPA: YraN family protein [Planctomycetota bacterium]|nr:YraN family protein [Planctomycetota bacterium]